MLQQKHLMGKYWGIARCNSCINNKKYYSKYTMKRHSLHIFILLIFGTLIFVSCTSVFDKMSSDEISQTSSTNPEIGDLQKVNIVTTIFPLYDIIDNIGGNNISSSLLIPPGAEPHTYEPKPSDIIAISKADIFVYVGAGLEPWADDMLQGIDTSQIQIIEAATLVDLISLDENKVQETDTNNENISASYNYDPHIWLNFDNNTIIASELKRTLIEIDPENSNIYSENFERYKEDIDYLDNNYKTQLSSCDQKTMVTGGHNAYRYLAQQYDFEVISAYGISPDSEPTPSQIAGIIDLVREYDVKYIVFEELVDPRIADALAEETQIQTIMLNPAGNISLAQREDGISFVEIMNDNLSTLKLIFECKSE